MATTTTSPRKVPSKRQQPKNHSRKSKPLVSANHVELERLTLLGLLYWRHCNPHDTFSDVPYDQSEISMILGWDQSRVSRRMAMIFPNGMKQYYQTFARTPAKGYLVAGSDKRGRSEGIQTADNSIEDADQELLDLIWQEIHQRRTTLLGIEPHPVHHLAV